MKYMCALSAAVNLMNEEVSMSDDLKGAIITALVTGIISIVGLEIMQQNFKHFKEIMNTIYSYGSAKAIGIVSLMQKENYATNGNTAYLDKYRMIAEYVLLATQIKYDVTEISVSPELWFQMRLTDYAENKENFKNANNRLVDELSLRIEFRIQ